MTAGISGSLQLFDGTGSLLATTSNGPGGIYTVSVIFSAASVEIHRRVHAIGSCLHVVDSANTRGNSDGVQLVFPIADHCQDAQNVQVAVNPGSLTITTPYTPTNPFVLPPLALSSDGAYLASSAPFPAATNPDSQQIVVTSTLAGDPGWTASVTATDLTDGAGGVDQLVRTRSYPRDAAGPPTPGHCHLHRPPRA